MLWRKNDIFNIINKDLFLGVKTMKYLLKNGTVVTGEKSEQLDILVEGEKIVQVGKNLPSKDAQEIDVSGKLLFPGFIDGHTHFDLEVAGTVTADDFETGTKAAILGGTTFVIDYASQDKGGHTLKEGLDKWHKKADDKCSCDYSFHMSIVEWNEKINLTAITEKDEVYLKHFYDSIAPILQGLIENQPIRLLDIGAGAGFPSLPMKILFPELDVTIIDSLNKRINFLHLLAEELGLSGVHFYHGRAEDFAQDKAFRAQFDIVTARAVARMQVLSELTIPYLKVGGQLLALKASNAPEELEEAKNALNLLFSKVEDNLQYELPNGDPRYITVVEKKKETPNKYPRKAGMPNKRPL